jgi:hypothetical protein
MDDSCAGAFVNFGQVLQETSSLTPPGAKTWKDGLHLRYKELLPSVSRFRFGGMFCVAGIEPQQKCLGVGLRGTSCMEMFDGRLLMSNKTTLGA